MDRGFSHWLLALTLASSLCVAQKEPPPLTNHDVITLVSLGFSDEVILDKIRATKTTAFDTSIPALEALKAAKVSDSVIRAMIDASSARPQSVTQASPLLAAETSEVGVYVVLNNTPTEIEPEIVNWQTGGFVKTHATLFLVKGDINGKISGATSATHVSMPVEFIIKPPEGMSVTEYQLLHLHRKGNRREFRAVTGGIIHQSGGAQRDTVSFEPERISEHTWRVRLDGLSGGEYGFLPPGISSASISASGKIYAFSVGQTEVADTAVASEASSPSTPPPAIAAEASIGAHSSGNPDARHDGITLSSVEPGGPADRAGLKPGDVILAMADHYLYTADELKAEVHRHQPGLTVSLRYRRYSTIYDTSITIGKDAGSHP